MKLKLEYPHEDQYQLKVWELRAPQKWLIQNRVDDTWLWNHHYQQLAGYHGLLRVIHIQQKITSRKNVTFPETESEARQVTSEANLKMASEESSANPGQSNCSVSIWSVATTTFVSPPMSQVTIARMSPKMSSSCEAEKSPFDQDFATDSVVDQVITRPAPTERQQGPSEWTSTLSCFDIFLDFRFLKEKKL